jgi:ribosome biogenesis protein ERB1|tara:strand:- start:308 stop:844 length:537 start_codon:yes stop_codon:yes gene_type:complete
MDEWEKQYNIDAKASDQKEKYVKWKFETDNCLGLKMIKMDFKHIISRICWHSKGDYFATMAHNIQTSSQVLIHSLSRSNSTRPFNNSKGIIQAICFHPTKPHFFACTHIKVFQYNLQKQSVVATFQSGAQWISSISCHPGGDNFILGTYDRKIVWFDVDMGSKPYKNLKYHDKAIRNV